MYTAQNDAPESSTSAAYSRQGTSFREPPRTETSSTEEGHTSLTVRSSPFRRKSTGGQEPDPIGLRVLYAPSKPHSVDIIFVHGLGGSSRKTWTLANVSDTFWPQDWLPDEPEIKTARILTFGYNADYRSRGPNNLSSISDFARALLFGMKFGKDGNDLDVGKVLMPIMEVGSLTDC